MEKPIIITLCGSTKFKEEFIRINFEETMKGKIVLTVGWFSHADKDIYIPSKKEKLKLDALHLAKIDISDEVFIINKNGYIGASTKNELLYAHYCNKKIRFLDGEKAPKLCYTCGCHCDPNYGHAPSCMEDNWSDETYYNFDLIGE